MKFFHLSDLHIGLKLVNHDLTADQRYILAQIVTKARECQPDAIVIAGDIYDKAIPSAEAVGLFDEFITQLHQAVPAAEIMLISGNHDSAQRVNVFRHVLASHKIHLIGLPPMEEDEYIPKVTLSDEYGPVNFYLLPFVKPSMVKRITGAWADPLAMIIHWLTTDDTLHAKPIPASAADAIRILTVHASKGLQAQTLFVPFCTWTKEAGRHPQKIWCEVAPELNAGTDYVPVQDGAEMAESDYRREYEAEHLNMRVDNLNMLYVALTRAEDNLYISTSYPVTANGTMGTCNHVGRYIMDYVGEDSYEAGDASWTDDFAQEFMKRRGYDPVPFLPVIAKLGTDFGEEREERFRRDFERTKNELQTERHYKVFKERLNAAGFKFHLEPYSGPFDSYEASQFCDVPMTEFWVGLPFWAKEPSKGGACWFAGPVARALGRNVTGAESFTGYPIDDPFAITPRDLKIPLDATLARGVNRLSLHHWEHQPLGARWRPGYSMGPWGTHFGENQTWHEPAKGFYRYIQRCQALLQEGEMRCDALGLSFNDEDGTDTLPLSNFLTNTEVTAEGRLRVKSSGREYSLLFFEPSAERRFAGNTPWDAVEKKCFDLVRDYEKKGLKVGPMSKRTKYFEIANGDGDGVMASCRRAGDAAFFFVANTTDRPKKFAANFRQVAGKDFQPEIWNPESGEKRRIGEWRTENGVTPVELELPAEGSVFVVFREEGVRFFRRMPNLVATEAVLDGPWTLSFDADGGAPTNAIPLPSLKSWPDFAESGIRYYSGKFRRGGSLRLISAMCATWPRCSSTESALAPFGMRRTASSSRARQSQASMRLRSASPTPGRTASSATRRSRTTASSRRRCLASGCSSSRARESSGKSRTGARSCAFLTKS